jgi:murein DD-endopeptidase MepM/ murein hydrolase activator NlpD
MIRIGSAVLAAMLAGATAWVPAGAVPSPASTEAGWAWPVGGDRAVLRPFIAPATPYGPGHRGVDILAVEDALLAPADGIVRFAGMVAGRPVLSIDHGDGIISSSEPVESALDAGDSVARGDPIGTVLDGHCAERCVHFGVRIDGEYVNPLRWLGGGVRPILLPTRHPGSAGASGPTVSGPGAPRHRRRARAPATRTAPP